jgi:TolB-like protein
MLIVVLGVGSLSLGQATTMPTVAQPTKVLVIPFTQIGDHGHEWVGAAIHENLVTQVSADSAVQAIGMNQPLANTSQQDAMAAAKGAGAGLVVFGSFQFAGDALRVNGRVMETTYGQTIATLSATGPIIDLFKIEDTLSGQVSAAMPQPVNNVPTVTYGPQPSAETQPQAVPYYTANQPDSSATAAAPTYVYSPTYGYPTYPTYSYPAYSYPDYYGGYYGGYPIVIYSNGFRGGFCRPFFGPRGGIGFGNRGGFRGGVGFGGGFRGGVGFRGGFGGVRGGFAGGGGHFGGMAHGR